MKILEHRALWGPNRYSRYPIIFMLLDIGEFEEQPSDTLPGFTDRLVNLVPSLRSHRCSVGEPGGLIRTGTITLAEDILGIIINDPPLDDTDSIFGAPGTLYPVGENVRGIELDNVDTVIMLVDLRTVSMTLKVSASVDQMRILTVPEPGTITLLAAGGTCILRRVRRKRIDRKP